MAITMGMLPLQPPLLKDPSHMEGRKAMRQQRIFHTAVGHRGHMEGDPMGSMVTIWRLRLQQQLPRRPLVPAHLITMDYIILVTIHMRHMLPLIIMLTTRLIMHTQQRLKSIILLIRELTHPLGTIHNTIRDTIPGTMDSGPVPHPRQPSMP